MTLHSLTSRCHRLILVCGLLLFSPGGQAQDIEEFDPALAATLLSDIRFQLDNQELDQQALARLRSEIVSIEAAAASCAATATEERARLEARFAPLREVDADEITGTDFDQRVDIQSRLNETIAVQTECFGLREDGDILIEQISQRQTALSQRFLSNRVNSIVGAIQVFPQQIAAWPAQFRNSVELELVEGLTPVNLFWILVTTGLLAALAGILLRQQFSRWFEKGGGKDAPPQMKYLFPKPLAEYSPLILEGLALVTALLLSIKDASFDLAVVRIAAAILIFGVGCVIIDWATGPLSPSASVKGLIPDHVKPLRLRLRIFLLAMVMSFVVLGTNWLAIRMLDPDVGGRATMIFLVAISLMAVINYLGNIRSLRGRFRLIRFGGLLTLIAGVVFLLLGYQNFAGYLVHGVTRTTLALFMLWILLWLVVTTFQYLIRKDTPTAAQFRANLGVTESASRTGLGFMQLVADLVLWLGLVIYLIYVWDQSGTRLSSLFDRITLGITVGNITVRPLPVIGAILIFVAILILIGWMKRWIDRRWLQQMNMERGAREALITLFGYVGFIIAVVIALAQAEVDLFGLTVVSGALAFGIGFGMQEIANNFVSGLILLFERPIRAGDFVTVGEIEGFVRSIRIRATEIETLDNQNVLVPNSELVSGRVTNWVLRDTQGRLRLSVGVAYGSDVEKVRDILESVACEHSEVITDGRAPAPRALFMGFGDSSLDFELRVRIHRIDRRFSVQSDINFAIDNAFREAGISIPFPQRDLHLITLPDNQPEVAGDKAPEEPRIPVPDPTATRVAPQLDSVTRMFKQDIDLPATAEEVWSALTQIEQLKLWVVEDGEFNAHIGGRFDVVFRDGTASRGRIDVYLPKKRMRMVNVLRDGEEPLASGPITTEFLLQEHEDHTHLRVTAAGIPATEDWEEDYHRVEARWQNGLLELEELLRQK